VATDKEDTKCSKHESDIRSFVHTLSRTYLHNYSTAACGQKMTFSFNESFYGEDLNINY